jgi:hypothetical protein
MPWNLLILPLAAGYFVITRCHFFKFRYRLLDRQKLLFEVVLVAFLLLLITYPVSVAILANLPDHWRTVYLTYRPYPYLGTTLGTVLLAIGATYFLNLFRSKSQAIKQAINQHGSAFDRLLLDAIEYPQLICFTLKNGKVYIGYPKFINDLVNPGTITIFPFYSGYRDETQDIVITTFYERFYEQLQDDDPDNDDLEFEQLFSVAEILSAKRFDIDFYDRFGAIGKVKTIMPSKVGNKPLEPRFWSWLVNFCKSARRY